jgi:hypothetical protein
MPTIVHFDIPADDIERVKKFNCDLFGWKIEKWSGPGTDDIEYWTVTTNAEEIPKMKQEPGKDLVLQGGPDLVSTFIQLGLMMNIGLESFR